MGKALYDKGRQFCREGALAWLRANIKVCSIDEADDIPDLANDDFLDDILAAAREFTSGNFASKSSIDGVADAADLAPAFVGASGDAFESITIYRDSGTPGTSELICNIDTAGGLPLIPDGGNIDIAWSSTADRIFKL